MKFGELSLKEAQGAILAHTHRLPPSPGPGQRGKVLKKGRVLGPNDLKQLAEAGIERVWAALLERGDVPENEAAHRLASSCLGVGVRAAVPSTGRVNLYAERRGLFVTSPDRVHTVNEVDTRLTLATLSPYQMVGPGEMIATVKIIPFAVPEVALVRAARAAESKGPILRVAEFVPKRVALITTQLPGVSAKQVEGAERSQATRIERTGSELAFHLRVAHETGALAQATESVVRDGAELVLLQGASAVVDIADVLPAAIEQAGGTVLQMGMPVDPGNLMVLGRVGHVPVIGVPGCARSLRRSGFDTVLERLAADLPVHPQDIQRMGCGGLLAEISTRPQPRVEDDAPTWPRVAGLVLAAGKSSRMGERNKLLETIDGVPIVRRVVDALTATPLEPLLVVVGYEAERVRGVLRDQPVRIVENPNFDQGLSTSLAAGIAALESDVEGVLIALGDMPFVTSEVMMKLFESFDRRGICVPCREGRRGHPVVFGARYFVEMCALTGDEGAKSLLNRYETEVREVEIDDDAIHIDVDTPAALEAVAARLLVDTKDQDDSGPA